MSGEITNTSGKFFHPPVGFVSRRKRIERIVVFREILKTDEDLSQKFHENRIGTLQCPTQIESAFDERTDHLLPSAVSHAKPYDLWGRAI